MRIQKRKKNLIGDIIIRVFVVMIIFTLLFSVPVSAKKKNLTISKTALTLEKGKSYTLALSNLPANNAEITWKTSNKFAVTVSKSGKVTAKEAGHATIVATCNKQSVSCLVSVPNPDRNVLLNTKEVSISEGETFELKATAAKKVTYFSRNADIATVDENGVITGVNPGIVQVVAKTVTGFSECTVTVRTADLDQSTPKWVNKASKVCIRRVTDKGKIKTGYITWAKNKDIIFTIANIDMTTVRKVKWSTSKKEVLKKPVRDKNNKTMATSRTLKPGTAQIIANVTFKDGSTKEYKNKVYVTAPKISGKEIYLMTGVVGSARQQYISFEGLSKKSRVTWTTSNLTQITMNPYRTKVAIWGLKEGSGTIKATVDGKTYKIKYLVENPKFGKIDEVIAVDYKDQIKIEGITKQPEFASRYSKVATVDENGQVKGIKAGVTAVDVSFGNMTFTYRVEIAAKGMKKIIKRANYIVNNWTYSQAKRMDDGYYDCSALVWKGYKAYNDYQTLLGSKDLAYSAGDLFDYLNNKGQIISYGFTTTEDMQPGDLIFYGDYANAVQYSTPGRTLNIYHVSMYAGRSKVVEKGGKTLDWNGTKFIVGIGRVVK